MSQEEEEVVCEEKKETADLWGYIRVQMPVTVFVSKVPGHSVTCYMFLSRYQHQRTVVSVLNELSSTQRASGRRHLQEVGRRHH